MNNILNTITVVISVTNVSAKSILAKLTSGRSVFIRTEYATASEVVESAIPELKLFVNSNPQ